MTNNLSVAKLEIKVFLVFVRIQAFEHNKHETRFGNGTVDGPFYFIFVTKFSLQKYIKIFFYYKINIYFQQIV